MKRYVKSSNDETFDKIQLAISKVHEALDTVYSLNDVKYSDECAENLELALNRLAQAEYSTSSRKVNERFLGIDSSTEIYGFKNTDEIEADDLPKGYYDDYFGQTAYEEYGDLVSEKCSGMIISKRSDEAEEPGGLIYESNKLGIDDFFDLLRCLEGMCYNGEATEISDYQYKVL